MWFRFQSTLSFHASHNYLFQKMVKKKQDYLLVKLHIPINQRKDFLGVAKGAIFLVCWADRGTKEDMEKNKILKILFIFKISLYQYTIYLFNTLLHQKAHFHSHVKIIIESVHMSVINYVLWNLYTIFKTWFLQKLTYLY